MTPYHIDGFPPMLRSGMSLGRGTSRPRPPSLFSGSFSMFTPYHDPLPCYRTLYCVAKREVICTKK
jgi:hypothetical protein